MSFVPTTWRPYARAPWGWKAYWRGPASDDPPEWRGQHGTIFYRSIGGRANFAITGVTRDSNGSILASCTVELFQTGGDIPTMRTTSDASGNFSFSNPGSGPFYLVAYKAGSPDVAGTTLNTLLPTAV